MDKKFGVIPIVLCLCFAVFLAIGDNPASAANATNQTAVVTIADVISITAPATISAYVSEAQVPTNVTGLQLRPDNSTGTQVNTITSQSNNRIDVFAKSSTGDKIWNNNATGLSYSDTLNNFRFTAKPGGNTTFATTYKIAVDDWKVAQGGGNNTAQVPVFIDVPAFTAPGDYVSIITYAAIKHGAGTPTWY